MNFEAFKPTDKQSFNTFFEIYKNSIPRREQKTKMQIHEMCQSSNYFVLLAKMDSIIGFSILFTAPDKSFCLLEYMAIAAPYRSFGYGKVLFLKSYELASSTLNPMPMLIELDSVREHSADNNTREKRQRFYRQLGCRQIADLDYILPLPGNGSAPVMDLLVYQVDFSALHKCELLHWLKVIYQQVYHCSPDDDRIARMLINIPENISYV